MIRRMIRWLLRDLLEELAAIRAELEKLNRHALKPMPATNLASMHQLKPLGPLDRLSGR